MELSEAASKEARAEAFRKEEQQKVEWSKTRYENAIENREAVEELGRRERERELPGALEHERNELENRRRQEQMRDRWGPPSDEARRERAAARQLLGERSEAAVIASQLSPPPYIVIELGERPRDPDKANAWDQGVRNIETFRHENGITDPDKSLEISDRHQDGRVLAEARLHDTQRRLERTRQLDRSLHRSRKMDRGLDFGIG